MWDMIVSFPDHCLSFYFMLLIERYKRQSSAKRQTVDFTESGKSLLWHKIRRGPSTVSWGTPGSTLTASDSSPSTPTFIRLFVRKSHSHAFMLPSTQYCLILWRSFLWGKVSNAFEKSGIIISIWIPTSNFPMRSCTVVTSCVSHEYPDLKPWFRDVCLFVLRPNVSVNNFSVKSGRSHRFLGN